MHDNVTFKLDPRCTLWHHSFLKMLKANKYTLIENSQYAF